MKELEKIDENFIVKTDITESDIEWFNVRQLPFSIYGVMYDETKGRFFRFYFLRFLLGAHKAKSRLQY